MVVHKPTGDPRTETVELSVQGRPAPRQTQRAGLHGSGVPVGNAPSVGPGSGGAASVTQPIQRSAVMVPQQRSAHYERLSPEGKAAIDKADIHAFEHAVAGSKGPRKLSPETDAQILLRKRAMRLQRDATFAREGMPSDSGHMQIIDKVTRGAIEAHGNARKRLQTAFINQEARRQRGKGVEDID